METCPDLFNENYLLQPYWIIVLTFFANFSNLFVAGNHTKNAIFYNNSVSVKKNVITPFQLEMKGSQIFSQKAWNAKIKL